MNAQEQQPRLVELLDRAHNLLTQARDYLERSNLAIEPRSIRQSGNWRGSSRI